MKKTNHFGLIALTALAWASCEKSEMPSESGQLELRIDRLEDLGENFRYEGWILVNGQPRSTGTFTVDADGLMTKTAFEVDRADLEQATEFMVTVEPFPDNDPAPSALRLLAGNFSGGSAELNVGHAQAFGQDFSGARGNYVLATPTDGMNSNELSGVWFVGPGGSAGLTLPELPAGWTYEGWAVIDFQPLSTGKFRRGDAADQSAAYSGDEAAPAFPGEDFLRNAPSGLSFPANLSGQKIAITVEPVPDNSPAPFFLKPLLTVAPTAPSDHTVYYLNNQADITLPDGMALRNTDF